jgi:hypothetical protein
MKLLDTFCIFQEEDTGLVYTQRMAMPYAQLCGPLEDVSWKYPEHTHVTAFRDEFGEVYHVLEPFQKVLDNWLVSLEDLSHHPIRFSAQ